MKSVEYNNIIYYIGNNAIENWELLDLSKQINNKYIWFHLNSFPSCYVIMYTTLNNLETNYSENDVKDYLIYGAQLCKQNSKYKNYNNLKILYTTLDKLTKTKNVGEVNISGKKNLIKL